METVERIKSPTISVIIPVYKVEQYLGACVDSILAQTFGDFELILVDDGSPDQCGKLCDEYARKDPRVRVIHQENQGLSGARNAGMNSARGEYITFVDSDDMITMDCLKVLFDAITQYDADISCIRLHEIEEQDFPDHSEKEASGSRRAKLFTGQEAVMCIYDGTGEVGITACGKLFARKRIEPHPFPIGRLHEDQFVIPIVLYEAERVVDVNADCYCYRKRSNSIMHTSFNTRRFDNLAGLETCIQYFSDRNNARLTDAAIRTKRKVNAILVVLAESVGAKKDIPEKYQMSRFKALYLCHTYLSNDTYSWYLSQLYPRGWIMHDFLARIKKRILSITGR